MQLAHSIINLTITGNSDAGSFKELREIEGLTGGDRLTRREKRSIQHRVLQ